MLCELLWPTTTFPKLTDAGDIVRPACIPVPVNEIVSGESDALLTTVRLPAIGPAESGANWIWTVLLWPAGMEDEGFPPTTVYPVPEMAAWETWTVAVPVFVTVRLWTELLPTVTFPKLTLAGVGESTPAVGFPEFASCVGPTYPAQPESPAAVANRAIMARTAGGSHAS
jgi:hypothetical protein